MYYVIFDAETGDLEAAYIQDLQPEHATIYIEVPEEIYPFWRRYRANAARDGLELIPVAPVDPNPEPQVPESVSMLAARLALINAGLIAAARGYIAGLPGDDAEKALAQWECSSTVRRDHPLVLGFQQAQGLTPAEVDTLFIAAAALDS